MRPCCVFPIGTPSFLKLRQPNDFCSRPPPVPPRRGPRRWRRRLVSLAAGLGADDLAGDATDAADRVGRRHHAHHRPAVDDHRRAQVPGNRPQRHGPRPADPAARGPARAAQRHQSAGGGQLDPLARADPAGQYGRCAGRVFSGHQAGLELPLPVLRRAKRHLLVPQPFRPAGTGRPLRPDHHRSRRCRSGRL